MHLSSKRKKPILGRCLSIHARRSRQTAVSRRLFGHLMRIGECITENSFHAFTNSYAPIT